MENQLEQATKKECIKYMKKPTILMHNLDFDNLLQIKGYENAIFEGINGIPVITRLFVEKGQFIVFDAADL